MSGLQVIYTGQQVLGTARALVAQVVQREETCPRAELVREGVPNKLNLAKARKPVRFEPRVCGED